MTAWELSSDQKLLRSLCGTPDDHRRRLADLAGL